MNLANNNPNAKRTAITIFALVILVVAIIVGSVFGIIYTVSQLGDGSTPSQSDVTSSDVSSEPSSSDVSSDVSSEPSSTTTPSQTTSANVSSTASQTPPVNNKKVVYLTFDDGPSKNTPELLNVLDELGVKATFFVVGNAVRANPTYVTEIVNRGHKIALHADSHTYSVVYKSEQDYYADLQRISDLVYNWTGIRSNIIRFPGGSSNKVSISYSPGIMTKITQGVQEKGYYYFDWNVDSGDASAGAPHPVEKLVSNVKSYTPKTINLLMHDTADKHTTIEALPQIVNYYKSLGYEFGVLDENAPTFHHKVNN